MRVNVVFFKVFILTKVISKLAPLSVIIVEKYTVVINLKTDILISSEIYKRCLRGISESRQHIYTE